MIRKRAILIGAGGFGSIWARQFLPDFAGQIEIVGLVDINQVALDRAGDLLGVAAERRFPEMEDAFAAVEADFCIIVVQPHLRWRAVSLAVARGLAILMEKPIADTWQTSLDILHLARSTNTKMTVIQNYPFTNRMRTLKRLLEGGELGRINFINVRFAADYTIASAGGAFRHQVPHAMLFEGAVHHFDQLRNLAHSEGSSISGLQWNPPWSSFSNAPTALFLIEMANGVACQFELNHLARGEQNGWHQDHYRVECEHGAVVVGEDCVVRTIEHLGGGRLRTTDIESVSGDPEGHHWIIAEFLGWLDGGPAPVTAIEDNIYTAALTFAAVDAVRERATIDVAARIHEAGLQPISRRFIVADTAVRATLEYPDQKGEELVHARRSIN